MIKDAKPLSMIEATEYFGEKISGADVSGFVKKFSKLSLKEAKELRKKLDALELVKLDAKSISKIIETLPENLEELAKASIGINLDDEEVNRVLEVIKEFK